MSVKIDHILEKVRRPSRYIGGEINSFNKPWSEASVRWCLAFPDVYEIGMSNTGLGIIYNVLNQEKDILADRVFAPWIDMEAVMREEGIPLWGLESRRPVKDFDVIGITLPYELTYTNIITILDLAGVPHRSKDRDENDPFVIGGGVMAFNPEPVAPFFDAILLGDGERAVLEINKVLRIKKKGLSKSEILKKLADIEGVYVPGISKSVNKSIVPNIDSAQFITRPVVPFMNIVHDRVGVEIQRGCARGCRFCQAGYVYRPVRQRSPETIKKLSACALETSGHEDLSFLSLSAGDYQGLPALLKDIAEAHAEPWINITLPSLRVETLTPEVLGVLKRSLRGGFTLAPEAGSERLRRVINKGNTEEDLLKTIDQVFSLGWRQLKLYFMIGLPTETIEDVEAIISLANKAFDIGRRHRRDISFTTSISTFVPKPHTPFQWCGQLSIEDTLVRQDMLKKSLRRRGMELKWHGAKMSYIEGVMSRGDSSLADVIEKAWRRGARFDAWDDQMKFETWMEVLTEKEVDPKNFVERERSLDEKLPWNHLYTQLDRDFLKSEYQKAISGEFTDDCVTGKCSNCGVCDFEEIKNRVRKN